MPVKELSQLLAMTDMSVNTWKQRLFGHWHQQGPVLADASRRATSGAHLALDRSGLSKSTHAQVPARPMQFFGQGLSAVVTPVHSCGGRWEPEPVFMLLMQPLQILHIYAYFFLTGSALHAAHANVRGGPQIDEPIWDEGG